MTTVLLLVHLFVTIALIGVVLIQRSEGGGLGIGTSQGMGAFMSGRGTANLLTRTTAILGGLFFVLSLTLALLNRGTGGLGHSLLDVPPPAAGTAAPAAAGSKLPPLPAAGSAPANTVPTDAGTPAAPSPPAAEAPPAPTAPPATPPAAAAPATPAPPPPTSGETAAPAAPAPSGAEPATPPASPPAAAAPPPAAPAVPNN